MSKEEIQEDLKKDTNSKQKDIPAVDNSQFQSKDGSTKVKDFNLPVLQVSEIRARTRQMHLTYKMSQMPRAL